MLLVATSQTARAHLSSVMGGSLLSSRLAARAAAKATPSTGGRMMFYFRNGVSLTPPCAVSERSSVLFSAGSGGDLGGGREEEVNRHTQAQT